MEKKWWMEAVGYQIYVKSFYDSNNDGIGDIRGIIEKLDYLDHLGVNLLWLCPFYKSPMDDNGYDVSDYFDVAPEYGTLNDVKELIEKAHKKGIKIIADLVLNHTSDEHPWFIESRSSLDNPKRDYYIWRKPKLKNGKEVEPTNWASFFGGSCWQKDETTGEYYMKIFSKKMPDLNWANPNVRDDMKRMTLWWLDLGIDGFRIDAVAHIGRGNFVDSRMKSNDYYKPDWRKFSNLPILHNYLKEMNHDVFRTKDIVVVGEVGGGAKVSEAIRYAGFKSEEMNMVFNFDHNWCNNLWDISNLDDLEINLLELKKHFKNWQYGLYNKSWTPIYWLNHDHPRVMSAYGNVKELKLSGKMLANALYFMWGTPFIYNGEEIGMTNYPFKELEEYRDVSVYNNYRINGTEGNMDKDLFIAKTAMSSRDNARTPMQWSSEENGGFTKSHPWMNVNPNYKFINVASQLNDEDSLFNYYRKVINLRRNSEYKDVIVYGKYELLFEDDPKLYVYSRTLGDKMILVIANFYNCEASIDLSDYILLNSITSNYSDLLNNDGVISIRPYESFVLDVKKRNNEVK